MLFEYSYYIQTDFDRNTKRPKFLLWLNKQTQTLVKDECRDQCPKLSFIEKMNVSLFRHLDSTVYYWLESNESNNSSNKGFLLWFVIDGQPLYCFRPEEDTFANEVRLGLLYDNDSKVILFQRSTKDKLKPYIVCSDPTNAQTLALTWLIALVVVAFIAILMVVIAVIIYFAFIREKHDLQQTTSSTSYIYTSTNKTALESALQEKQNDENKKNNKGNDRVTFDDSLAKQQDTN